MQTLAGIPEELLRAIELAEAAPDPVHRVARHILTEDNDPPSEGAEDDFPRALERILAIVDQAWLREQRKIPCRLDREFLEGPLSLVHGVRAESERPAIHRFAQAVCVGFEAALADLQISPVYQGIAEDALQLQRLRMDPNRIAVALKVDRTTVVRALRWIKDKSTYPDQGHIDP